MSVEAFLESEYAVLLSHPAVRSVELARYSANRLDGYLRARYRRWDNTPHFPELPGFPHHRHVGDGGTVEPSSPINLTQLLDHIASLIG